jgi:hypothetical protein
MTVIVTDCPVHLLTIQQAKRPVVLGFHPIVNLRSGDKK